MMTTSCSRTGFKEKWLPFMMSATLSGLLCASSTNADYPLAVEERSASSERIIDSFLPADIHAASSMESLRQIADANPAHVFAVVSIMASKRLRELPLKKLESTQYSDYTAGNASLFLERLEFDEDGFITSESFRNAAHEAVLGFSESDEVVIIETQFLPEGPLGHGILVVRTTDKSRFCDADDFSLSAEIPFPGETETRVRLEQASVSSDHFRNDGATLRFTSVEFR